MFFYLTFIFLIITGPILENENEIHFSPGPASDEKVSE